MTTNMERIIADCGYAFNGTRTWPNCTGFYHYDDETCSYGCLAIEYLYWTLQSLLGYQDGDNAPPGRCQRIADEWQLCNAALMEEHDPVMTAVLRTPDLRMPSAMPDGTYAPSLFTLKGDKTERNTCPFWQQMGCLMDATEKICEGEWLELLAPYATESLYMCCCPQPYLPCMLSERDATCDESFRRHVMPLTGNQPSQEDVLAAVQRVREDMRVVSRSCEQYTASSEPPSQCGALSTETGRTVEDPGLFCETIAWQWEELVRPRIRTDTHTRTCPVEPAVIDVYLSSTVGAPELLPHVKCSRLN
eukprot:SAG31_NODE_3355_length_4368_cov_9.677208_2_plen_305_part_00